MAVHGVSFSFSVSDSSLRGGFALCFLDDGEGMDPSECLRCETLVSSVIKNQSKQL